MVGEWRRDGSSGWVSSSHPSPAPHRAADCGDRWPGLLCLPNLGLPVPPGWGQQGLKLSPLLLARNFCLPALGLRQSRSCHSSGAAGLWEGLRSAPDGTNTQWAAGAELPTCPQAPVEAGTQHGEEHGAAKGSEFPFPFLHVTKKGL